MRRRSCFFIGHRDTSFNIYPLLVAEVERHIVEFDVKDFFVGHYGSFDSMAVCAVKEAKEKYPAVRLIMLLPYHPAIRPVKMPAGFDASYFPSGQETVPPRAAIVRANRHMVGISDYLICFVHHPSNGAREVMELALRREKRGLMHVTNLAGWIPPV